MPDSITPTFSPRAGYKPLFPYFGGKSQIAADVWARLGNVPNYVEPFFGSGAVLFLRPHAPGIETINDADGFVANLWRAIQAEPEEVARLVDWPVSECDLHARHLWMVNEGRAHVERLKTEPDYYDLKCAGWWLWGICQWIGSGWCQSNGTPSQQLPHLGGAGMGVHRKLPHLGGAGRGEELIGWFADRLRNVRICCGDWSRVCGPTPTVKHGLTGVFLDPPYSHEERTSGLYGQEMTCASGVREWALEWGEDPRMRIALCGYQSEHDMPASWECHTWKARGGYGSQGNGDTNGRANALRETVWFSPNCLRATLDFGGDE